jgi:hypothetical protein
MRKYAKVFEITVNESNHKNMQIQYLRTLDVLAHALTRDRTLY